MQDLGESQLVGRRVESVSEWPGCKCVIEFGQDYRLQIECLWRLRKNGVVTLTGEDDGQSFGKLHPIDAISALSSALIGSVVENVRIVEGSADLLIEFGGVSLEAISDSSGYEAWQLVQPAGQMLVAQGGGNVAVWNREA